MAINLWRGWIDSEYYQRRDIESSKDQAEYTAHDVAILKEQVWKLQTHFRELSITAVALIELLAESSGLDTGALQQRIDAISAEMKNTP